MDSVLLKQLDRVEAAFSTLIDSITSYNPSVPAAIELSAADDTLTQGLNEREKASICRGMALSLTISYSNDPSSQLCASHISPPRSRLSQRTYQIFIETARRHPQRSSRHTRNSLPFRAPRRPVRRASFIRKAHQQIYCPTLISPSAAPTTRPK